MTFLTHQPERRLRIVLALPVATALATLSYAQGADDCLTPQAISGAGPFTFDTTTATTDGLPDPACSFFNNDQIFNDVWFEWTATQSGPHVISLCQPSTIGDTRVALYEGGCNSPVDACNDDFCQFISQLPISVDAGQTYLIRIGNFSGTPMTPAVGDFVIEFTPPILNPANGNHYLLVDANLSWTDASAQASQTLFQGVPGHLVTFANQAELDWVLNNIMPGRPWIGLAQNLMSPTYAEPAGGFEWVTGEPFTFVNWANGEPNNTSASGGAEDFVEMFGSGEWNDAEDNHAFTNQYLIEWEGNATVGMNYCMAAANSTGASGAMSATGSAVVSQGNLVLRASNLPVGQFGIFVTSQLQAFVPGAGGTSNGNLCIGGQIGRFNLPGQILVASATGEIELGVPLGMIPQGAGFVGVLPGDTWNFQAWHRDPVGLGSNFTDGLSVLFQ